MPQALLTGEPRQDITVLFSPGRRVAPWARAKARVRAGKRSPRRGCWGSTYEDVHSGVVYPGGELKATEYPTLVERTVSAHQGDHPAVRCNWLGVYRASWVDLKTMALGEKERKQSTCAPNITFWTPANKRIKHVTMAAHVREGTG